MEGYERYDPFFGSWHIKRLLGKGGFGQVFEVEREDFGRIYRAAMKIITIPSGSGEINSRLSDGYTIAEVQDYFRSCVQDIVGEFELMSKLKGNSHIVSYEDHQVIEHEDHMGWDILIRMELLTTLSGYIRKNPFGRRDVVRLGIDLCRALEVCRKYKIIHRDIKPDNIFVSDMGDYKLGDFGIARIQEKTTGMLSKKGTWTYMAPEVYQGRKYGSGVDLYALGLVMYRLVNENRMPFLPLPPESVTYRSEEQALERRISGEALPKPSKADGRLAEIIQRAAAYDPKDRYPGPEQMQKELEEILNQVSGEPLVYPHGDILTNTTDSKGRKNGLGGQTTEESGADLADGQTAADPRERDLAGDQTVVDLRGEDLAGDRTAADPRGEDLAGDRTAADPRGRDLAGDRTAADPRGRDLAGDRTAADVRGSDLAGERTAADPGGKGLSGDRAAADSRGKDLDGGHAKADAGRKRPEDGRVQARPEGGGTGESRPEADSVKKSRMAARETAQAKAVQPSGIRVWKWILIAAGVGFGILLLILLYASLYDFVSGFTGADVSPDEEAAKMEQRDGRSRDRKGEIGAQESEAKEELESLGGGVEISKEESGKCFQKFAVPDFGIIAEQECRFVKYDEDQNVYSMLYSLTGDQEEAYQSYVSAVLKAGLEPQQESAGLQLRLWIQNNPGFSCRTLDFYTRPDDSEGVFVLIGNDNTAYLMVGDLSSYMKGWDGFDWTALTADFDDGNYSKAEGIDGENGIVSAENGLTYQIREGAIVEKRGSKHIVVLRLGVKAGEGETEFKVYPTTFVAEAGKEKYLAVSQYADILETSKANGDTLSQVTLPYALEAGEEYFMNLVFELPVGEDTLYVYMTNERNCRPGEHMYKSKVNLYDATQMVEEETEAAGEYVLPESDSRYYAKEELAGLTQEQLRIARNEIAARHGRKFADESIQNYFNGCSWYTPTLEPEEYDEGVLNDYEVKNSDLIVAYEKEMGYRD